MLVLFSGKFYKINDKIIEDLVNCASIILRVEMDLF